MCVYIEKAGNEKWDLGMRLYISTCALCRCCEQLSLGGEHHPLYLLSK